MARETNFDRRKRRVRFKLRQVAVGTPRLTVHRSSQHIYAQIIDDSKGITLVSASSVDKEIRSAISELKFSEVAKKVGEVLAKRAIDNKLDKVVFDRGGYIYHGRIKALADGAREAGLKF